MSVSRAPRSVMPSWPYRMPSCWCCFQLLDPGLSSGVASCHSPAGWSVHGSPSAGEADRSAERGWSSFRSWPCSRAWPEVITPAWSRCSSVSCERASDPSRLVGSPSSRRFRTSSCEAMARDVSAASAATIARPHALVSAFISSLPLVNEVRPGNGSAAIPTPGKASSGERYAAATTTSIVKSPITSTSYGLARLRGWRVPVGYFSRNWAMRCATVT